MRYTLAVLTHGESKTLDRAMESFWENVTPWPSEKICVRDGQGRLPGIGDDGEPWRGAVLIPQRGFCEASRSLWKACLVMDTEYVFWLEHDFVFDREVDLRLLADELDDHRTLAQMALMRGPVNALERERGVLGRHETLVLDNGTWCAHSAYFTTNPSLMRREFMEHQPWPDESDQCEGKFGISLREQGYSFGVWGDGFEPWVTHIGERDGFGY